MSTPNPYVRGQDTGGHCDEIYLKIRGQGRWLFAVMDSFSSTILAYEVSRTKMNFDPYQMFVAARTQAGVSARVLVTDGLQVFARLPQRRSGAGRALGLPMSGTFTCKRSSIIITTTCTRD